MRLYFAGEEESGQQKRGRDEELGIPAPKRQKTGDAKADQNANYPVISPATALSNLALGAIKSSKEDDSMVVSPGSFPGPFDSKQH